MINLYAVKEWFAFVLVGIVPTVVFVAMLFFSNIIYGILSWLIVCALMIFIARRMLKNPFSDMLKGKGLLTLNIDSTGKIGVFISRLSKGVITGFFDNTEVSDSFDRDGIASIGSPVKTKGSFIRDSNTKSYKLSITDEELYDSRFAFSHYPCLIYNNISQSFVTKTQISNLEKNMVAHNKLIYLAKRVESLNRNIFHFARHVIDQLKPKSGLLGGMPNWVSIMIFVAVLALLGILIWKGISGGGSGALSGALGAAKDAVGGVGPITPNG